MGVTDELTETPSGMIMQLDVQSNPNPSLPHHHQQSLQMSDLLNCSELGGNKGAGIKPGLSSIDALNNSPQSTTFVSQVFTTTTHRYDAVKEALGHDALPLRPNGLPRSSNVDMTSTGIFSNLKHAWRVFKPMSSSACLLRDTNIRWSLSRHGGLDMGLF